MSVLTLIESQSDSTEPDYSTQLRTLKGKDLLSFITNLISPEVSSDHKVIDEVIKRDVYRAKEFVKEGSVWLDIGANIGTFALQVLRYGGRPICYEPCKRNFDRLERLGVECHQVAVSNCEGEADLFLEKVNHWRHTLKPVRGRKRERVKVIDAMDLPPCDGIKIDAEGMESEIIFSLKHIPTFLVFEYDGGHHPYKKDYDKLIAYLKTIYSNVQCPSLKEDINFWPNGLMVRCWYPK